MGPEVGVVVLAGGAARRLGGIDKVTVQVGGRPVLDRLLAGLPWPVVVVGPRRTTTVRSTGVAWVVEDPPGGGPAVALGAGVRAMPPDAQVVLALAGDLPFAGDVAPLLLDALEAAGDLDGVTAVDESGRRQWLLAAYRRRALLDALAATAPGDSLHSSLAGLRLGGLAVTPDQALDVDTRADLNRARLIAGEAVDPGP